MVISDHRVDRQSLESQAVIHIQNNPAYLTRGRNVFMRCGSVSK